MKLFYHHVGQKGSEDFKKTVFKEVPISVVEDSLPLDDPTREELLQRLRSRFPGGKFNCWGVPAGAKPVIQNLTEGDCVLLVESVGAMGRVPALCQVDLYWRKQLRPLSRALWGDDKFPYIFFFRTEELSLNWIQFLEHLDYKENFDPRGKFYSVADNRLVEFGGVEQYVVYLRTDYSQAKRVFDMVTPGDLRLNLDEVDLDVAEVDRALVAIKNTTLRQVPALTEGLVPQLQQIAKRPRNAAFVVAVRRLYGASCAFCGAALRAPNGQYEVQSAHIFPKRLDGSDDLRNGICLCRRHHWAFDVGWMSVTDDYTILVQDGIPAKQDYAFIQEMARKSIRFPVERKLAPHPIFLREHRRLLKFE